MRSFLGRHEPEGAFDEDVIALMSAALDDAFRLAEVRRIGPKDAKARRELLARGIVNMAKSGHQDRDYLAANALAYLVVQPRRRR